MDEKRLNKAIDFIRRHNQYPDKNKVKSELPDDIMYVLGCSESDAKSKGESHCNLLSWYALLLAEGLIDSEYKIFFKSYLNNKWINDRGYINVEKQYILDKMSSGKKIVAHKTFKDVPDSKPFQVLIQNKHGKHFLFGNKESGAKYYDTNYRGTGFQNFHSPDEVVWYKTLEDV